ncbi:MAG: ABC transporter permease [Bifidobacteriaceae bacterium]|jgi:hypothetical protein|nr:ABC transporter permease [Bifidobacteriaceae bacterium]
MTAPPMPSPPRPARFPLRAAWSGLMRQRSIWALIGVWLAMTAGFGVVLNAVLYGSMRETLSPEDADAMRAGLEPGAISQFAAGAMPFYGAAMALLIGVVVVGGEYRAGTVRWLYTQGPGRLAVIGAQLVALVGLFAIMALATLAVDWVGLVVVAPVFDMPIAAPAVGPVIVSLAGMWLTALVHGLIGAALAVLARGTVWALAGGLVWVLAVETALVALVRAVPALGGPAHGLLAVATSNLAVARGAYPWWPNAVDAAATVADGWVGAGVLAAWGIVATAVACVAVVRRDVA